MRASDQHPDRLLLRVAANSAAVTAGVDAEFGSPIDPLAWLTDLLTRIVTRQTTQTNLASLLPWNWKDTQTYLQH